MRLTQTFLLSVLSVSALLTMVSISTAAPPLSSPPPLTLLQNNSPLFQLDQNTQSQMMDDPTLMRELEQEESLEDLQEIEYNREALSISRGTLLSLIPGGGWSLMYANRRAQGVLMVLGATLGYGMGAAYALGVFDESADKTCVLTDSSKESINVELVYCNPKSSINPTNANANMPAYDPYLYKDDNASDPARRIILKNDQPLSGNYRVPFYSEVSELYQEQKRGTNYKGLNTGLSIIAGTYAVTTVLSAVWSAVEIADQNNELRKRIESTSAQAKTRPQPYQTKVRPTFQHDGQQTIMGFGGQF
ncbi:MAG: hypothetical protein CMH49_04930 [Myxococcales bacterium]|nr:hypothetical protein [Myxococcales bacterium]